MSKARQITLEEVAYLLESPDIPVEIMDWKEICVTFEGTADDLLDFPQLRDLRVVALDVENGLLRIHVREKEG